MARSQKKGYFIDESLEKKISAVKSSGNLSAIRTYSRRSTIDGTFLGLTFLVHNGKAFVSVTPTEDMIGCKLGEFVPTRRFTKHPDKKSAKK